MVTLSVKSLLRGVVAGAATFSGWLASLEHQQRDTLTILCYHRVLPQDRRLQYFDPQLVVTPEMFDAQCGVLARHFDVITLERGLLDWRQGRQSSKPRAAITFDDGYRDNETYAVPILARHGLEATFYVVSGLVGSDEQPWYDRAGRALMRLGRDAAAEVGRAKGLSPLERGEWLSSLEAETGSMTPHHDDLIMDEAALRRLVAAGHEIGSHTVTHPLLDQLAEPDLDHEVLFSRTMLETASGAAVSGFCYPNGNLNEHIKVAVTRGGYAYSVSTSPGVNRRADTDILALKRWFISQDRLTSPSGAPSAALFRMEISGLSQRLFRRESAS